MPQQVNLCSADFRPTSQGFTARMLVRLFGVFLVLGSLVLGVMLQNLHQYSATYLDAIANGAKEIQARQAAVAHSRATGAPPDSARVQQLQELQAATEHIEQDLAALKQGVYTPGQGHSDWLYMVARSIPASVWLVTIKLDADTFEASGFTLDPGALNEWLARLRNEPLMRPFELSRASVDAIRDAQRPTWAFSLISRKPKLATDPASQRNSTP